MVNIFMTVKQHAVAFWEQSPARASLHAPKDGALAGILLMAFPKSLILQKLHMSFWAPERKIYSLNLSKSLSFPYPYPTSLPRTLKPSQNSDSPTIPRP